MADNYTQHGFLQPMGRDLQSVLPALPCRFVAVPTHRSGLRPELAVQIYTDPQVFKWTAPVPKQQAWWLRRFSTPDRLDAGIGVAHIGLHLQDSAPIYYWNFDVVMAPGESLEITMPRPPFPLRMSDTQRASL